MIQKSLLNQFLARKAITRPWDGAEAFWVYGFAAVLAVPILLVIDALDRLVDKRKLAAFVLRNREHHVL